MLLNAIIGFVILCIGSSSFFSVLVQMTLKATVILSKSIGLILMTTLYGWYGFDPFW
jgi:hypothetical protein